MMRKLFEVLRIDKSYLCIEYISTLHNIDNACNLWGMDKNEWHNGIVND